MSEQSYQKSLVKPRIRTHPNACEPRQEGPYDILCAMINPITETFPSPTGRKSDDLICNYADLFSQKMKTIGYSLADKIICLSYLPILANG